MRPDVWEFYQGLSFDAYRLLGAHPAGPGRGWQFTCWAPHARRVQVLGDWNGWDLYHAQELAFCEDGLWRGRAPAAREGQLYKYNIQGPDGVWRLRSDPFALAFEPLPGTAGQLTPLPPPLPALRRGPCWEEPLHIYELHTGSWRRHWDGRYYDGAALADALLPWARSHGFTHLELLPLAEFPFDGSWGYQGCGYFAPSQRIGGPAGFRALVERLHRAGIGVILDFVPVHFAPDEGRLANFDGAPLFEMAGEAGKSDWGSLNFDLNSGPVRSFLLSSAAFWLHLCGCDGLRVDAIGNALYRPGGGWQAAEFFRTLTAGLHARFPGTLLVAEDTAGALNATALTRDGGLGFDYVWDTGWTRDVLDYFTAPFGERPALFDRLAAITAAFAHTRGINALNHDENAPRTGAILARLWGDDGEKLAQMRLLLLYQFARPGKKLNFMGVEFGQRRPFTPAMEPEWALLGDPRHQALDAFYRALAEFYPRHPALFCGEDAGGCFVWAGRDPRRGVLGFVRRGGGEALLCAFNTGTAGVEGFGFDLGCLGREVTAQPVFAAGPLPDRSQQSCGGWLALDLPPLSGGIWSLS